MSRVRPLCLSVVVVLGFYVPPTAKVIRRRGLGLKSHPKDWRSPGSNSGPLVYKAGSLTARPLRLLSVSVLLSLLYHLSLDTWSNASSINTLTSLNLKLKFFLAI